MEEASEQGPVLYTTTTRIHPPDPSRELAVISCGNPQLLKNLVDDVVGNLTHQNYRIVVTGQFMEPDLLKGVPPDFFESVDRGRIAILLNEADGAARFSLKLPRDGEPVLMTTAEYLVPVIGIDCLHQPLGPEIVFRFQALADLFSLRAGDPITPGLAADILMHPRGVCKDYRDGTTIIPFINKVDTHEKDADARILAARILQNGKYPVNRVVWGSVLHDRVVSVSS